MSSRKEKKTKGRPRKTKAAPGEAANQAGIKALMNRMKQVPETLSKYEEACKKLVEMSKWFDEWEANGGLLAATTKGVERFKNDPVEFARVKAEMEEKRARPNRPQKAAPGKPRKKKGSRPPADE